MANVIREDVVQISFVSDAKSLNNINSEVDQLKSSITGDLASGLDKASSGINDINTNAKSLSKTVKGDLTGGIKKVSDGIDEAKTSAKKLDNVISGDLEKDIKRASTGMDKFKKSVSGASTAGNKLNKLQSRLKDIKERLTGGEKGAKGFRNALKNVGNASVNKVKTGLTNVKTKLTEGVTKAAAFAVSLGKLNAQSFGALGGKIDSLVKRIGVGLVSAAKKAVTALAALGVATGVGIFKITDMASDLDETLNKVDVAFGGNSSEVKNWAKSSITSMGLAQQTALDMTALFGDMGTSMGLSQSDAADMSMSLTQLGADLASFKNMDIEEATTALNGVFTGETESLKRLGVVMTQTNLEQYALTKGITKSIDEMTEAEKVQLRYNYVMDKTTNAQGDFVRTGGGFANQLRMLKEQVKEIGTNLGKVFLPAMTSGLKVFNKFAKKINDILSDGFQSGDLEKILGMFGSVGAAVQKVVDKIKSIAKNSKKMNKLKDVLKSIKKVLDTAVSLAGDLIVELLDFATAESTINAVKGVVEGLNDALTWVKNNLDIVKSAIVGVVGVIAGLRLGVFIGDLATANMQATTLKEMIAKLGKQAGITIGITLAITGLTIEIEGIIDTVKNGLSKINFAKILGGGGLLVGGGAIIGAMFSGIGAALGAAIAAIPAGIGALFAGIWDACKNGIDWLSGILITAGSTMLGPAIASLLGIAGGPMGALVGFIVGLVIDLVILVVQNWDTIVAWCKDACSKIGQFFKNLWSDICAACAPVVEWIDTNVIQPVVQFFVGLWNKVEDGTVSAWSGICSFFSTITGWIDSNIIQPVKNFFVNLWSGIKNGAVSAWNGMCSFFSTIAGWVDTNIIQPVKNFFLNFFYFMVGLAVTIWEGIKAILTPIASWVNTNIVQPVVQFFVGLWNKLVTIATNVWTSICTIWGIIASWVNTNIIIPVVTFFTNLWTKITTIARNIWTSVCTIWNALPSWVYNNVVLPVVNFFRNLWTSITTIARNVWTSICTIWGVISSWVNTNVIQPVINFFKNLWTSVTTVVRNVWTNICSIWGRIASWVNSNIIVPVKNFFSGLWSNITQAVGSVRDAITGAFQAAYNKVVGIWEGITGFFSKIWDGIKNTVNKLINKGKEALGVESDVNSKEGGGARHAWGGLMTFPHWGQVAEDGPEMIIPLSKDKRDRGLSLWQQAGALMGVKPTQAAEVSVERRVPSYTPESTANSYYENRSSTEYNTYSPQFSITVSGTTDDRVLARKIKKFVQDGINEALDGAARSNPKLREV